MRWLTLALLALTAAACTRPAPAPAAAAGPTDMDRIAERYVKLVLAVGQHDADYVDAYYGDPSWRPSGEPAPLPALLAVAASLRSELAQSPRPSSGDELLGLRYDYLGRQLAAVESRLQML